MEMCKERSAANAYPELQAAWDSSTLPAHIKKNLSTKLGIHHTCMRVAAKTSGCKLSR